jgi:hypothetical protein
MVGDATAYYVDAYPDTKIIASKIGENIICEARFESRRSHTLVTWGTPV